MRNISHICLLGTALALALPDQGHSFHAFSLRKNTCADKSIQNKNIGHGILLSKSIDDEVSETNVPIYQDSRIMVPLTGILGLGLTAAASSQGVLPFEPTPLSTLQIQSNIFATCLTSVLGYVYVQTITYLTTSLNVLEPKDSRKLIHLGSAPLFMLFWPLFSSRYFCALVPLLNALRLFLSSKSPSKLAQSVSRSGDASEVMQGPFLYVCVLTATILGFGIHSPIGILGLICLAVGDGLADLVGRRWGKSNQWGFVEKKSVVGSLSLWLGSTLVGVGMLVYLDHYASLSLSAASLPDLIFKVALVSFASAVAELIPIADDNLTVPLAAMGAAALLF